MEEEPSGCSQVFALSLAKNATDLAESLSRLSRLFSFFKIFSQISFENVQKLTWYFRCCQLITELQQIQDPLHFLLPQLCPVAKPTCCSAVLDVTHYHIHDVILHQGIHTDIWQYWNTCWFWETASLPHRKISRALQTCLVDTSAVQIYCINHLLKKKLLLIIQAKPLVRRQNATTCPPLPDLPCVLTEVYRGDKRYIPRLCPKLTCSSALQHYTP